MASQNALLTIDLPGIPRVKSGKVREVFDLGDSLLFVATDRISAFDCIMPNGIPGKGEILTRISDFWFKKSASFLPNHLLSGPDQSLPERLSPFEESIKGRSMIVRKLMPLPIECVVRGYLAGSGWKEYQKTQTVCGVKLPAGLQESSKLPSPIFTPATKAEEGHDENISFAEAAKLVGPEIAAKVCDASLHLYQFAADYALSRGIIIADTKFEFAFENGQPILIDEVLTPDSSRFWPQSSYQPGRGQSSFDKQFVRDYLETLDWNKQPPAPVLPENIVAKTREKYLEAFRILTS